MWSWTFGLTAFVICFAGFVFIYGKGFSYFSSDPAACANCHIMTDTFESWNKSQHHANAKCNDCHLPRGPLLKWVVKGVNGMHHSYAFTFQNTPAVLRAAPLSKWVVQQNCVFCHQGKIEHTNLQLSNASSCVHCHANIGHNHF